MGKFSDKIRSVLNPNKQKQIEFNRQHGLRDDAKIITIDQIEKQHDTYFIRLTDNHNAFVKVKHGNYYISENPEMSCLFSWKDGNRFIEGATNANNLELVRMDVVLK